MTMAQIPTATPAYDLHNEDVVDCQVIDIADNVSGKMEKCYSLSKSVKALATIDLFFSAFYALFNYIFFFPLICIAFGLKGSTTYNLTYTAIYLVYTFLINTLRLSLFFYYYWGLPNEEKSNEMLNFVVVLLCSLIGLWITRIIHRFMCSIRALTSDELNCLRQLENYRNYATVYW